MRKRRSIRVSDMVYEKISDFCEENNVSMSKFIENRISEYKSMVSSCPVKGNWSRHESWILTVTYNGKRDMKKDEAIQIFAGRRGAFCENGLSFIFDAHEMSNEFLAKETKKRILRNVNGISAGAWRCRLDHGMG
jgi:hypothetical protein